MDQKFYLLKTGNKIKLIDVNSLLYVSVNNNLLSFFIEGQKKAKHYGYGALRSVESDLPDFFVRVKQETLINGNKIIELDTQKREVTLKGGITLSIAYRRLKEVKNALTTINNASATQNDTDTP